VANRNPKTENLKLGRGKRPKLNNVTVGMRMSPETKTRLEEIAEHFGCYYAGKPWIAGLLEKIGSNELIVSEAPKYLFSPEPESSSTKPVQAPSRKAKPKDMNQVLGDALVDHYSGSPRAAKASKPTPAEENDGSESASVPANSHGSGA
jgi:hypothetical protein